MELVVHLALLVSLERSVKDQSLVTAVRDMVIVAQAKYTADQVRDAFCSFRGKQLTRF